MLGQYHSPLVLLAIVISGAALYMAHCSKEHGVYAGTGKSSAIAAPPGAEHFLNDDVCSSRRPPSYCIR